MLGSLSLITPIDRLAAIGLAAVFICSASEKLRHWYEGDSEVSVLGLPLPSLFAALTVSLQLAGGVSVAIDWFARCGAATLALFIALAAMLGHKFWLKSGAGAGQEFTTVLDLVAIIAGPVFLAGQFGCVT